MTGGDLDSRVRALGYAGLSERDALLLDRALGGTLDQLICLAEGSDQGQDDAAARLRSALFSVSASCVRLLLLAGLDEIPTLAVVRAMVRGGKKLRLELQAAAEAGHPGQEKAREVVRRAIAAAGTPSAPKPLFVDAVAKVYGQRYALSFERTASASGQAAIQVEIAAKANGRPEYQWAEKLAVQLTEAETVGVLGVLVGAADEVEYQGHGSRHDKTLTMKRQQGGGIYVSLRQGRDSRGVPVPQAYGFRLTTMCAQVLSQNNQGIPLDQVLSLAKQFSAHPVPR